ncbi:hypothetical protein BCR39DRAFT_66322 [Naematelia encephala]|uniref:Uncharacterized protein n=1 Tax=Naematelia encephala TaxID=71784 RepID=A0A1Y2AF49_9TREE|nr:hypothetical protein BCR39DRAFT_66322 [Naematelia encephala]
MRRNIFAPPMQHSRPVQQTSASIDLSRDEVRTSRRHDHQPPRTTRSEAQYASTSHRQNHERNATDVILHRHIEQTRSESQRFALDDSPSSIHAIQLESLQHTFEIEKKMLNSEFRLRLRHEREQLEEAESEIRIVSLRLPSPILTLTHIASNTVERSHEGAQRAGLYSRRITP